jgi:hypothetical protein
MTFRPVEDRFPWVALAIASVITAACVGIVGGWLTSRVATLEMVPVAAAGLKAVMLRASLRALVVALALCIATCSFVVWQRAGPSLGLAIAGDVALIGAFITAPWIAHGMSGQILDPWLVRFGLAGVLPSVAAGCGVVAFVIITRRASQHGAAAA